MKNETKRRSVFFWKQKIFVPLAVIASSTVFSGCAVVNFFDVSSAMTPPALTEEQTIIKSTVEEYIGKDFKWVYPLINGKYTSVLDYSFGGGGYVLVFCQTGGSNTVSHVLIFEKSSKNLLLKGDLIEENFKIEEVEVKNISNDGKSKEITAIGNDLVSLTSKAYTYQIIADDKLQIKVQKYLEVNP